ncbi:ABC transporter ATP-binding protein, partial [Vibrio sp. F13]
NTHQFRRTLIVNFLTHDLASAPAVKQQVKHMYQYMTEYYGKGSELAFTQRLLRDWSIMEDIANEHILVKTNIYRDLYYSDCHLEGVKGKEIEAMRESAIQLTDDEIRVLIETGEWDITKTPFGYCTKAHKCEKTDTIDPS